MADLISAQKVFEQLVERRKRFQNTLDFLLCDAGEKALEGKEITDYTRTSVADHKARLNEIDEVIKIMQKIVRDSD